jgi:hypothetical protein
MDMIDLSGARGDRLNLCRLRWALGEPQLAGADDGACDLGRSGRQMVSLGPPPGRPAQQVRAPSVDRSAVRPVEPVA